MKLETTFFGKYFYFGSIKGALGYEVDKKLLELKAEAKQVALVWYEEQVRKLMDEHTRSTRPVPAKKKKKRRRAEAPAPVVSPANTSTPQVDSPRRRRAPEPQREPEPVQNTVPEELPRSRLRHSPPVEDMLLGPADTCIEPRHKDLPTYQYAHGDTLAWYKGEPVELDDYESTVDIELDPEHIYWMDMNTKRFVFKTYID